MFKKLAAAGAISAVMGGVILGSSPAQADSNDDDGYSRPSFSYCRFHEFPACRQHRNVLSDNGSGNHVNELIPIQICRLDDIGALIGVPLHNVALLGAVKDREDSVCYNGPAEGSATKG